MADDRRPPDAAQALGPDTATTEAGAAYVAAHKAFMAHVKDCYACRRRGTDCQDVGALKARLRDTQAASLAARTTAP